MLAGKMTLLFWLSAFILLLGSTAADGPFYGTNGGFLLGGYLLGLDGLSAWLHDGNVLP